jgi:DNA processing protein
VISPRIQTVAASSAGYPESLRDLDVVPDPLYAIGDLALLTRPMVSIVGTREPTAYGLRTARNLSSALARNGVVLVSGMARGIDAAVHRAALDCGGTTIAVLGTGIDVPYPAGHAELHRVIGERGLLLSENGAGLRAHKGAFPKRNRIIAALGKLTIVVEGGHQSGAINTANHVLSLGKTLAAVPGPIDSPQSQGTNHLLRDGASVVAEVADALALAGISAAVQAEPACLSGIDGRVWSAIGGETVGLDVIARRAGLTTRECLTAVSALELSGVVESLVTGEVRRR